MPNLVLIGYRGAGKTTVGRLLAHRLGYAFVDTDPLIAERAGKSIAAIFAEDGESAFRELEAAVIAEAAARSHTVLSAGGGAVLRHDNRRRLRARGTVFWLAADAETLWERIRTDPETAIARPPLTEAGGLEEVRRLLAKREPHYRRCAHYRIDAAGRAAKQIADEIETLWKQAATPHPPPA